MRIGPTAPCDAPPLAATGGSPGRPPAAAAAGLIGGCTMGYITCCGTGAAIELDASPDGDSIAAILLSSRSITVTTTDISEFVTWETGPDTSVAGEGDRPIVVDGRGVVVDIGGDSIGTLSGAVILPDLVGLSIL